MSGAPTWTLIVGFLSVLAAGQVAVVGLVLRVVRAESSVVRAEMREQVGEVRAELREQLGEIRGDLRVLGGRFEAVERELGRLRDRVYDGETP